MFRPEHQYTFRAQRKFTDRDDSRSLFINAVDDPQPHKVNEQRLSPNRVLMFYGVGGQGKSALYKNLDKWLTRQTGIRRQEQRLAHVTLDLEEGREGRFLNPVEVLLRLRLVLKARGGFPCPHFDVAFARYFALSRPGINIREAHPELFRNQNELVSDAVDMAEDAFGKLPDDLLGKITELVGDGVSEIPGWGFLVKYADRLRIRGQEWWEQRGLELLDTLDGKNQAELLQDLPLYLGADLTRAQEANPKLRLVVLVDTFEYLWRDTSARGHSYLIDDWLKRLIINAPGVLFTIFGRDKVRWGDADAKWNEVLEQHRLGGLSDEDSDTFLHQAGLEEVEIRQVIVASSKGGAPGETPACLPYYLDLQLQQYEKDRNDERTPQAESYGGTHTEIIERFLKPPYTDRPALQTLLVITCVRTLTRELYDALTQTFLAQQALSYAELTTYSFVTEQDGRLVLHALMREYLQTKYLTEDPSRFNAVHEWLFTYYDAQAQPEIVPEITPQHEGALREAAFHKEQTDKVGFATWCLRRCVIFQQAARYVLTAELYQQAWAISEMVNGLEHPETLISMNNLASNLSAQGQYAKAQKLNEQILEISMRTRGSEHSSTLTGMNNLATNFSERGQYAESQRLNEQVVEISTRTRGLEHPDTLTSMNNLASDLSAQKQYAEAQRLNERLLEVRTRILGQEHPDTLASMNNLVVNLSDQGQYAKAQQLNEQIVEVLVKMRGQEHPITLTSMNNLAVILRYQKQHAGAQRLNERLLEVRTRILGQEHPDTLTSMNNLALDFSTQGEYVKAQRFNEQALEISKRILGQEHPNTLITMGNLASNLRAQSKYAEAQQVDEQVVEISTRTRGVEHPDTLISIGNLAKTIRDSGSMGHALAIFEDISERSVKTLGENHPDTLRCRYEVAVTLFKAGEHERGHQSLTKLYPTACNVLGSGHPWVLGIKRFLDTR